MAWTLIYEAEGTRGRQVDCQTCYHSIYGPPAWVEAAMAEHDRTAHNAAQSALDTPLC